MVYFILLFEIILFRVKLNRVWAVQLVEHTGTKVTKGRSSRWRKAEPGEPGSHPGRSAQAGRPPL
jgi:hypothetical protein